MTESGWMLAYFQFLTEYQSQGLHQGRIDRDLDELRRSSVISKLS